VSYYQADDWHERLEEAEGDADADPRPGIDPAEADADGAGEVAEADRQAYEQQAEEGVHGR